MTTIETKLKERPILFSGPMVRTILEGRKTQTRRVLSDFQQITENDDKESVDKHPGMRFMAGGSKDKKWGFLFFAETAEQIATEYLPSHCPYGKPGDRLWVRETWAHAKMPAEDILVFRSTCPDDKFNYACPQEGTIAQYKIDKWRPSIHMPRWASRINLEITNVRVERLQDISEEDAYAEGIDSETSEAYQRAEHAKLGGVSCSPASIHGFADLWDSINGPGSWDQNPWVWVIEFRRVS